MAHQQKESSKVYVIFDGCHMIKLIGNLLSDDYMTICHVENQILCPIQWKYIKHLNTIQENAGYTLANKLKRKHIMCTRHKMNVSVTAQTLSASVVSSIDFHMEEIHLSEFEDSEYSRLNQKDGHWN